MDVPCRQSPSPQPEGHGIETAQNPGWLIDWDINQSVPQLTGYTTDNTPTGLIDGPAGWAAAHIFNDYRTIALDHQGSVVPRYGLENISASYGWNTTDGWFDASNAYRAFGSTQMSELFLPTWAFTEPRIALGYRGELTIDGLTHLRARDYRPDLGTFTTRDPLHGTVGTTTLNNAYHYADNNPTNRTDPTGLYSIGDGDFEALPSAPDWALVATAPAIGKGLTPGLGGTAGTAVGWGVAAPIAIGTSIIQSVTFGLDLPDIGPIELPRFCALWCAELDRVKAELPEANENYEYAVRQAFASPGAIPIFRAIKASLNKSGEPGAPMFKKLGGSDIRSELRYDADGYSFSADPMSIGSTKRGMFVVAVMVPPPHVPVPGVKYPTIPVGCEAELTPDLPRDPVHFSVTCSDQQIMQDWVKDFWNPPIPNPGYAGGEGG